MKYTYIIAILAVNSMPMRAADSFAVQDFIAKHPGAVLTTVSTVGLTAYHFGVAVHSFFKAKQCRKQCHVIAKEHDKHVMDVCTAAPEKSVCKNFRQETAGDAIGQVTGIKEIPQEIFQSVLTYDQVDGSILFRQLQQNQFLCQAKHYNKQAAAAYVGQKFPSLSEQKLAYLRGRRKRFNTEYKHTATTADNLEEACVQYANRGCGYAVGVVIFGLASIIGR